VTKHGGLFGVIRSKPQPGGRNISKKKVIRLTNMLHKFLLQTPLNSVTRRVSLHVQKTVTALGSKVTSEPICERHTSPANHYITRSIIKNRAGLPVTSRRWFSQSKRACQGFSPPPITEALLAARERVVYGVIGVNVAVYLMWVRCMASDLIFCTHSHPERLHCAIYASKLRLVYQECP